MPNQSQAAEAKKTTKATPAPVPEALPQPALSWLALPGVLCASGDGSATHPGRLLADPRLCLVQRQALAAEMGSTAGNAHLQRFLADVAHTGSASPAPAAHAQRLAVQRKPENEAALAAIQGQAMFSLLPQLDALPPLVKADEEAGAFVGGPRLVTAMHVVKAKGASWLDFAAAHNAELAALPTDQIADIMRFLGAPKDARYFTSDEFDNRFDGSVDPVKGVVTLYFRVRFEVYGAKFGAEEPGTKEWEEAAPAFREQFAAAFKQVVEDQWSGKGSIKPACPVGSVASFETKVVVTAVESGEHKLIQIVTDVSEGRSRMGEPGEPGTVGVSANEPRTRTEQVSDPTGRHPEQVTTTQVPSSHEFGHAIGLQHPHCPGSENVCYGVTAEERRSIMGTGSALQVIERGGKVRHNDFAPFERIAKRWGQEVFPGALVQKCNEWSHG